MDWGALKEGAANIITAIDGAVWGWPMIILLFGTHLFMTVRTRGIQRKLGTAIRLSVTKDTGSEGEVSQFGALTTALASTIGTGNIIGVGTAIALGGPGSRLLVLADRCSRNCHEIWRSTDCGEISCKNQRWTDAGGAMYALERGLNLKWLAVLFGAVWRVSHLLELVCDTG